MQFELPNSPGVTVTVNRGGTDPITGETLTDQWVSFTWDETYYETVTDADGEPQAVERTRTVHRGFLGPE